jgi:hypothetical protein
MPQKVFSGRCRGGPWDGKDLAHEWPRYRVPIRVPFKLSLPTDSPPETILSLKWGVYHHVADNWIWRDEDAYC